MWQEHSTAKPFSDKYRTTIIWLGDVLLAREGIAAYLPITLITIFILIGASWQAFLPGSDPARYQCYALTFWFGGDALHLLPTAQCTFLSSHIQQASFTMLPLEYPPLTLLPFSLALLMPLPYYQLTFAFLMGLVLFFIYWLLLKYGPRGSALAFAAYLFLGEMGIAQARYDLLPAALTLLCVIAAERKHWAYAYTALAFATLLKIYPILLLPALFIAEQQSCGRLYVPSSFLKGHALWRQLWQSLGQSKCWRWHNLLLCLATIIGITVCFALANFKGAVLNQFIYFLQRPIQVEASGSSILWLADRFGSPYTLNYTFGSVNINSALGTPISHLSTILLIVGTCYVLWMQWRGRLDLTQAVIALLFVFIATGKVFSPQYLIWLIPLLAYAGAFDIFWVVFWGSMSLFTSILFLYFYSYPVPYPDAIPLIPGFFEMVTLRNALFILLTLTYLANWFQARERRPLPRFKYGRATRPLR